MLIAPDSALAFINGYKDILFSVLSAARIERTQSEVDDLAVARTYVKNNPESLNVAIATLNADQAIVHSAVRRMMVQQWVYLRQTKRYAVFVDVEMKSAFQVKALTTPLNELAGRPPAIFEAGLFPYDGWYVCDGLVANAVTLGPHYKASYSAAYNRLLKEGDVHVRPAA